MNASRYFPFAGRLLIGLPFAMSGFGKLAAAGATRQMITAAGLPFPSLALAVAIIVELGGGLSLIAGFRTRFVGVVLAVFSVVAALSFHANLADQNQMIHFLKNVMIAGGLLQIVAFGAGALSTDNLSPGRPIRKVRQPDEWHLTSLTQENCHDRPCRKHPDDTSDRPPDFWPG